MTIDTVPRRSPLGVIRSGDRRAVFKTAAPPQANVSIAGVVLLSALAVALTIVGVLVLGAVLVVAWWLVSHIPVPPFIWRLLAHLRLTG
jgi:hypothetical protein